jgi:hypothetical protein
MEDDKDVVVRFDWDRAREKVLDISIRSLERLADKVDLLSERADRAIRLPGDEASFSAEDDRLVREAGRLLRATIIEWRDACIERNKARGITGEYAFDIRAAEAEVERRLAELAKSASRQTAVDGP